MTASTNQQPRDVASDYAAIQFIVGQLLSGLATATLVRVMKCTNDGGVIPVGTVDVQLLVDQITGDGETIPHGTVFKVPYNRIQGGTYAVILDPQPGDIGVCVFASRDISAIKTNPDAARNRQPVAGATPGSRRTFSLSDGLYVASVLNPMPTDYVQFNSEGVRVVSPNRVRVESPTIELIAETVVNIQAPDINLKGAVHQTDGDVDMAQNLDVQGTIHSATDVVADTISGKTHTHNDPQGGATGPPNP